MSLHVEVKCTAQHRLNTLLHEFRLMVISFVEVAILREIRPLIS